MANRSDSFTIRPVSMEDAAEITDLVIACDIAEFGQPDFVLEDLLDILAGLQLESDTWVVRDGGRIVGFAFTEVSGEGMMSAAGYVHPDFAGFGIGTDLAKRTEERARAIAAGRPEARWTLANAVPALNGSARSIMENGGYEFKRLYSRMIIDLTEEPTVVSEIGGLEIRDFQPGMEQSLYDAYRETFRDTNRFYDTDFGEWIRSRSGEHYDRNLWFTAWENGEMAGFVISKNFKDHVFVDLLGVRRAWRKRGAGSALLLHVFRETYRQGIRNVQLSVDASSLTGANLLYERLGMKAAFQLALYEKEL
ncbi:GNAT family N-acetyltransferase [Cohnella sp. CFH 77786]|uniref:GNAT family N-acetyltransferase n=1 Tax=Cohnella sp. CFH 77786 TaxID=2662265 RepID=UPI001C60A1E6|nr:GNAT family N-acetyltransferase [Cohnella sp. CFH 77786]MBW5448286.1 GNAT family N-acetyltransferase [Cohnella sp. CFH 77786]